MIQRSKKIILLTLLLIAFAFVAMARPGGGHGYSGGGSWGGGGSFGGGGDGGSVLWLLYLLPPEISIPLIIIVVLYGIFRRQRPAENFTMVSTPTYTNFINSSMAVAREISQLKALDHNFSRVLFLDFVSSLYMKFYEYQDNKKMLKTLNPFFDKQLLDRFLQDPVRFTIKEIVIGGMNIERITLGEKVRIHLRIKSNMTIVANGRPMRYIIDERWTLERDRDVLSPGPEKMHTVTCPACGAPADFNDAGYCSHCGTLIVPGKKQWYVVARKVFDFSIHSTQSMLTYAQERGTSLPTVYDPYLQAKKDQFSSIHGISWAAYEQRFVQQIVRPVFGEVYKAWSGLQWNRVRHLLSDRLWESYRFWIEAYKDHGYRNILDVHIERVEVAKVEIDRFYESITVRIYAQGLDYIIDKNGKVVAGNSRSPRRFSEYWTFIRRSGVEKDQIDMKHCPACGAPADRIGQSGVCEYCGNKITWGDFSWILAIITQDEEYRG